MAPSIVALSCPNCGANLDLKPGVEQITCPYCCKAVVVNWGDDALSHEPTGKSADQEQEPESVQKDLRARERLADHALLQRVQQERMAAEATAVQESRQLSRLDVIIGQNRFYGFAAIGFALLIAACLGLTAVSALSSALRSGASAAEAIGAIYVEVCLAGIVLGVGLFMVWALHSASRRLSSQIGEQEQHGQFARTEVERLRQQEAQVRDRLVG